MAFIKHETIQATFTNDLRSFLKELGYSYMLNEGDGFLLDKKPVDSDRPFVLIPLLTEAISELSENDKQKIESIDSNDIIDMANGDDFVRIVVELPMGEFELYLKK